MRYYQKIHRVALVKESPFITLLDCILSYLGIKKNQAALFANC